MAVAGLDNLNVLRINKLIKYLMDIREGEPGRLRWLSRTPRVNAEEGELFASFVGRILMADLIADDAEAAVYNSGHLTFETNANANIKMGRAFTQSQLRQFYSLINSGKLPSDERMLDFFGPIITNCLIGIDHRIESMLVGLHRDKLDYDRLGIRTPAGGVTWGMPAELKSVVSVFWTSTSATPVTDILTKIQLGRAVHGVNYNRVTMSTDAFNYAIATTEFQNKAAALIPAQLSFTNLMTLNTGAMKTMFESLLGVNSPDNGTGNFSGGGSVTIELSDERFWYQLPGGTEQSARYLPNNEVIIDSTENDNNPAAKDIAVGEVIESMTVGMDSTVIGGNSMMPGPRRGPFGYAETRNNPPNIVLWAVDRAFPRKHRRNMNAHLTVGSFGDTMPITTY